MSEREKIVEVMARAMCAVDYPNSNFDRLSPDIRRCWMDYANAAFYTAIRAAGRAVVPMEPTEKMIEAGYEAVEMDDCWHVSDADDARKLYRAMLAASQEG